MEGNDSWVIVLGSQSPSVGGYLCDVQEVDKYKKNPDISLKGN